jgi:Fe-S-cluster containining protein
MELALDHPRFRTVDPALFTRRMAPDCMTHRCTVVQDEHGTALAHPIVRNDVCCQYGCDVDLAERDAILAHAGDIGALLRPEAAAKPWFDDELFHDADYPSGAVVRSAVHEGACIFIAHDQRGCAIHRAALESGWDMRGVKPAICRLYPVSYDDGAIILAPEYPEYSCAHAEGPSLYRLTRDLLGELFGEALVIALDAAEARALAAAPEAGAVAAASPRPSPAAKRLPIV